MDNKKRIEKEAVSRLLRGQGLVIQDGDLNLNPEEPADVVFLPTQRKYQVTQAQGEIGKLLNFKAVSFSHNASDTFKEFIEAPLKRKLKKYGGGSAVSDVTLIIYDNFASPWIRQEVESIKTDPLKRELIENCGFAEIYLIYIFQDTEGPMRIFP